MKPSLFVFGLIISAQISVIKGYCYFKHGNEPDKFFENNCECGHNRTSFQCFDAKYCCVPSNSTCDESRTNKWCADGQLLPEYQPCNGSCIWSSQEKCPQINGASFTTEQCYSKGFTAEDEYSVILV